MDAGRRIHGGFGAVGGGLFDVGPGADTGAHGARLQGGDPDHRILGLVMQHRHQALQAGLGDAIGAPVGFIDAAQVFGHEHYGGVAGLAQHRQTGLSQQPWRGQVDVDLGDELFRAGGFQRTQAGEIGRTMQDAMQTAQLGRDLVGHGLVIGRIGAAHVERIQGRLRADFLDGVVNPVEFGHFLAEQHHRGAGRGRGLGRRFPQAAVGTRDQDDPAGQAVRCGRRQRTHAAFCASATIAARSPLSNSSKVMSQPPISSPLMNSCGKVGQSE